MDTFCHFRHGLRFAKLGSVTPSLLVSEKKMNAEATVKALKNLLDTVVQNTKRAQTTAAERRQTRGVLAQMLQRPPTDEEVDGALAG